MFSKILLLMLTSASAFGSYQSAESTYGKGSANYSGTRRLIIEMVKDGYYFSVVPWMKNFLVTNAKALDPELEQAFDKMLYATGVKTFESLPTEILQYSRSANIRYILAKRLLKKNKLQEALEELNRVNGDSSGYAFVSHMKGTVHSLLGNQAEAQSQFRDCVRISGSLAGKSKSPAHRTQLLLNKDYCIAGIARAQYAAGDYKKADLSYLDIQKESNVWPEILFEEAWNSYYLKNYNRTLGKLVSYRAPVFDFIFKPDVDVLRALTFLRMCLYDDASKTVDEFYERRLNQSRELRTFLQNRGKDYGYYYQLMSDHEIKRPAPLPIVDEILRSVHKDGAFVELKTAFSYALHEYNQLRKQRDSNFKSALMQNMKIVLDEYKTAIGAYVRAGLVSKYAELYRAFQGMSYIKLEVLALKKERLYKAEAPVSGKRGDLKYLERNDKQYFWTFNGEFWADELGDYVFALRSEC
jgi:hypothetical protein